MRFVARLSGVPASAVNLALNENIQGRLAVFYLTAFDSGWNLLDFAPHRGVWQTVRDLNYLYRSRPALHARDCEPEGFSWLIVDDRDNSVFAWLRSAPDGNPIAVISNFTPVPRENYRVPLPKAGKWREIINTDAADYGGSGMGNGGAVEASGEGSGLSATMLLPPLSTIMLEFVADWSR